MIADWQGVSLNRAMRDVLAILPASLQHPLVGYSLQLALWEDLAGEGVGDDEQVDVLKDGDITSRVTLPADALVRGVIVAKSAGVIAGLPLAAAVFSLLGPELAVEQMAADGNAVSVGDALARVTGPARQVLAAERTALNYLGRMSGIATLTRRYVDAVAGTGAVILDTRKTAPGLRHHDKYAVRMGGGMNHRMGLYDMVLIKDNHIDAAGSITAAVERVRARYGDRYPVEVEAKTLGELHEALALRPDRIMLDNMSLEEMRRAVEIASGRVPLEASGNVSLETVRPIAETGVDYISVGALTHSAPVLDVSMRLE